MSLITISLVVAIITAIIYLWPEREGSDPQPSTRIRRLAELVFFAAVLALMLAIGARPIFSN